jgi:hypothetical protein
MQISDLRDEVRTALRAFAWDQWAQMGVLASTQRHDGWAADPEALMLLTFEAGRDDPRLFDEVLGWLLVNERLTSVQRLRNLARDADDRALVEASLGWVARWRPRARLTATPSSAADRQLAPVPLFRNTQMTIAEPDRSFLAHGLLKAQIEPSRKSRPPDIGAPINFALRMRHLLGVGARAEVVRILLCSEAPDLSALAIAESAAYAKRNVQEALTSLCAAGVIDAISIANTQRYRAPRARWSQLLDLTPARLATHRAWPQLFHPLRRIMRWLADPAHDALSDYMRASEARLLIDEIAPELRYAGVALSTGHAPGAEYWQIFIEAVHATLRALSPPTDRADASHSSHREGPPTQQI